ncbi:MAG: thioredoxin family protein [Anaerolineaceae bacterium]|nr:thioredoxin family protein [Anaerolineaceae bacterium]
MDFKSFESKLKLKERPVVVDLWAPWCAPCRAMEPAFEEISSKYKGKVDVWKINADQSPEVLKKLGVMGIPTVIGFAGGEEIYRRSGMQTTDMLDTFFDATMNQIRPAIIPPSPMGRITRTLLGSLVILIGWLVNQSWLFMVLGGLIIFSAYYDRCPVMQMVIPKMKSMFKKG